MRATAGSGLPVLLLAFALGCGDDGGATAPPNDAERSQQRFDQLADSLAGAGASESADVARAVAELLRLSGRVSTLETTFDGRSERFTAVALQLTVPETECPPDANCLPARALSPHLVLAWQGDGPSRVLLFVADTAGTLPLGLSSLPGSGGVIPGSCYGDEGFCEDASDALGDGLFGDDGPPPPHFATSAMAEPASEQIWPAVSGTFASTAAGDRESCPASTLIPAGVSYRCTRTDVRVAFDARYALVATDEWGAVTGPPAAERTLTAAAQAVAGVRITVTGSVGDGTAALLRRALRRPLGSAP